MKMISLYDTSLTFSQELERLKMEQARDVAELMRKKKAIVEEKQTDTQTKSGDEERRWVNLCQKYTGQ